jgi:hypothetical protein
LADQDPERTPTKELGVGLGAILERIADFFDIFDLSFFVSGATTLAALTFWGWRAGIVIPAILPGWLQIAAFVIGSYVFGLICFAVARWPRRYWVMSATYDGLGIAILVWLLVIVGCIYGVGDAQPLNSAPGIVSCLALLVSAIACWGEAGRYIDYQMEELVACLAERYAAAARGLVAAP